MPECGITGNKTVSMPFLRRSGPDGKAFGREYFLSGLSYRRLLPAASTGKAIQSLRISVASPSGVVTDGIQPIRCNAAESATSEPASRR